MKAKRARLVKAEKERQKCDEKTRVQIKERLLALEIQRRKDAKAPPESNPANVEVNTSAKPIVLGRIYGIRKQKNLCFVNVYIYANPVLRVLPLLG